jgi:hypothetical protein
MCNTSVFTFETRSQRRVSHVLLGSAYSNNARSPSSHTSMSSLSKVIKGLLLAAKSAFRGRSSKDGMDAARHMTLYECIENQMLINVVQCVIDKVAAHDSLKGMVQRLCFSPHELMLNCMYCIGFLLDGPCLPNENCVMSLANRARRKTFVDDIGFTESNFNCLLEVLRESLLACKVVHSLAQNVMFLCALRKSWVLCEGVFEL